MALKPAPIGGPPVERRRAPRGAGAAAALSGVTKLRWPGWAHLPREARDALFLLGVIAWAILPHFGHLPFWCLCLTAAVLLWRARLAINNQPLPGRWALIGVLAVAAGLTLWSHNTLLGKEAGVTMLVVLMVLKTLELRARRDALVVFFLGFFLVLTNFLYSQSLLVAAAMIVAVWGLLTALVLAHMPVGKPSLRSAGGIAGRAALLGAPVMIVLFLLFPRIGPLWGLPQDAMAKTGLSGSLMLGGVAELALDDSVAFRVRFDGAAPPSGQLYWRGPVMSDFDGREWRRLQSSFPAPLRPAAQPRLSGRGIGYEMTLEPSQLPLLTALELTPDIEGAAPQIDGVRLRMGDDLQWSADRPLSDRVRVRATAWPRHEHGPTAPVVGLQDHLNLPPGYNPRTLAWAADLRRRPGLAEADAVTLSRAVLEHVRAAGYTYTLSPGLYGDERGRHAIDEFWLDRKLGFCEHFASAYVVVMRALDVPARIVTGYQGADPAQPDGWAVVRQSHAHAWAEIWQPGRGWLRVDPTAAVAPDRIEYSHSLRPAPGFIAGALGNMSPELLQRWRDTWELVNNRYNQWVLNYARSDQFDLLRAFGFESPNWEDLGLLLLRLLTLVAVGGVLWALWDRWRQDPWQRLQRRVRRTLGGLGIRTAPHEAPRTLAARVQTTLGDAGAGVAERLLALDRQRYGRNDSRVAGLAPWWRSFRREAARVPRSR